MKKLLVIFLFATAYSFATPPLLLRPNTATIDLAGTPKDTVISIPRLLMVETLCYDANDSTISVSFNCYVNIKEFKAHRQVSTNVPTYIPKFKLPDGTAVTMPNIYQAIRQYFTSLGYSASIQ